MQISNEDLEKKTSSDTAKNQRLEHASNNSNSSSTTTNNNNNKTDLNSNHIVQLIPNQFDEIVPPNEHVPNPELIQRSGPYECKSCHSRFVHDYQVEFPIVSDFCLLKNIIERGQNSSLNKPVSSKNR